MLLLEHLLLSLTNPQELLIRLRFLLPFRILICSLVSLLLHLFAELEVFDELALLLALLLHLSLHAKLSLLFLGYAVFALLFIIEHLFLFPLAKLLFEPLTFFGRQITCSF